MSRTVAYVRVSTDKQDLENQRYEIERYCAAHGLIVDEWDQDIASGTTKLKNRQAGALIERLDAGDTFIVSEVSRISRSVGTLVTTLNELIERGVNVVSVKENITFKDDITSDVMMVGLGLAAQLERRMISARTKEALARRRAEGVRLGRPPGRTPESRKLHGKDDEILRYMRRRVSKAAIARLLDVSVSTLRRYITERELEDVLLLERVKQTDVLLKRTKSDSIEEYERTDVQRQN